MSDFKPENIEEPDVIKQTGQDGLADDADAFIEHLKTIDEPIESESLRASTLWRAAKALKKLRDQLDTKYPNRSKASDGFIGDAAHCANADGSGNSDHCPNIQDGDYRIVTAYDATHDPENGCDIDHIVESIRSSKDERVKYIIWNRKICNYKAIGGAQPWQWRAYGGSNPHDKHCHISVRATKALYDNEGEWSISPASDGNDKTS